MAWVYPSAVCGNTSLKWFPNTLNTRVHANYASVAFYAFRTAIIIIHSVCHENHIYAVVSSPNFTSKTNSSYQNAYIIYYIITWKIKIFCVHLSLIVLCWWSCKQPGCDNRGQWSFNILPCCYWSTATHVCSIGGRCVQSDASNGIHLKNCRGWQIYISWSEVSLRHAKNAVKFSRSQTSITENCDRNCNVTRLV